MGKKNRKKKTTWRRLSLTDDKVTDGRNLINDTGKQGSHDDSSNNRDKDKKNARFRSNLTTPRRTPSSPSSGTPPHIRSSRGWNTRDCYYGTPFLVPCTSNGSNPDEYPTSFPEECNYNEEQPAEDENAFVSENQEIPYQQYVFQTPLTPIIPMIIQPPYHPLQWCDDPRLPPDVQYYVCFTQPFPQQSHFTTLQQPSPPTSPTSGPESDDAPSSISEDAGSERLIPGAIDEASTPIDDAQVFQPFIPLPPPPPYILPNTFAFKPPSYNTTNGCYWWNDNGFVRGFKRRRRRFFVGGEGITYDRWPSRKDRIAAATIEPQKPQLSLTTSKGASVEVNMSDQIPAVHQYRDGTEQGSPHPSAVLNHHTIETLERQSSNGHSSQDSPTIDQGTLSDENSRIDVMPLPDILNEEQINEPPADTSETVEVLESMSQEDVNGDSVLCTEEEAKSDESFCTPQTEDTEKTDSTSDSPKKTEQEGCQDFKLDTESMPPIEDAKVLDTMESNVEIKSMEDKDITFTLQDDIHFDVLHCQEDSMFSFDKTSDVDNVAVIDQPVSFQSLNIGGEPVVAIERLSIDDEVMEQGANTYFLESDSKDLQSSGPITEEGKTGCSSITNTNFTPLDRQLYERLEDPMTCSKYYQICTDEDDALEEEIKSKPIKTLTEEPSIATLPAAEIVIHEAADSASECGSEDVEMIGHRYETTNDKKYKSNTVSLAAELLGTNQQLPYDKEFKPLGQEGSSNVCYTNTHVLEGFYGRLNRQAHVWRRDVADSGIHTDESGDEAEQRRRSQGIEDDEVLFSRNQRGTNAFQYQPFGRRPRGEYPPMLYLRSKGPWQGCCCSVM